MMWLLLSKCWNIYLIQWKCLKGCLHFLIHTTELLPQQPPRINDWWYYATETGQHIAFYTRESLQVIAKKFKKNLYAKHGVIIFSSKEIPSKKINLTFNHPRLARLLLPLSDKSSLLPIDYNKLTGKVL